jgi:hypothetical protein
MGSRVLKLRTEETARDSSLFYDAADNGWRSGWVLVERASKHDQPQTDSDYWTESEAFARLTRSELADGEEWAAEQGRDLPDLFERVPSLVTFRASALRRAA